MTQTIQEFAELNNMDMDKAVSIVKEWTHSKNPGLEKLAYTWLGKYRM